MGIYQKARAIFLPWKKKEEPVVVAEPTNSSVSQCASITFSIDKDLRVTVSTDFSDDIKPILKAHDFLSTTDADAVAVKYALILIANETSDQLIDQVNNEADNAFG